MKLIDLFEEDEPLAIEIIQKQLEKGGIVRAFYNGNGGQVESISWRSALSPSGITYASIETEHGKLMIDAATFEKMKLVPIEMKYRGKLQKTLKLYLPKYEDS